MLLGRKFYVGLIEKFLILIKVYENAIKGIFDENNVTFVIKKITSKIFCSWQISLVMKIYVTNSF